MKKIMFNDRYGLMQAVLNGRKTMTRRIATALNHPNITDISEWGVDNNGNAMLLITYDTGVDEDVYPHFQIGDEVAVAQSYHELNKRGFIAPEWCEHTCESSAGYNNKMFVRADLMPNRIRITNIKVERLQDITSEDCLKEGIEARIVGCHTFYFIDGVEKPFNFPRQAFASLIDRICGRGTWERNPWVFVYEFELVK